MEIIYGDTDLDKRDREERKQRFTDKLWDLLTVFDEPAVTGPILAMTAALVGIGITDCRQDQKQPAAEPTPIVREADAMVALPSLSVSQDDFNRVMQKAHLTTAQKSTWDAYYHAEKIPTQPDLGREL